VQVASTKLAKLQKYKTLDSASELDCGLTVSIKGDDGHKQAWAVSLAITLPKIKEKSI
jgi:hypothetical protein